MLITQGSVVRIHLGPDSILEFGFWKGPVAQLGERLLCKQGVSGSIPLRSILLCCVLDGVAFQNELERSTILIFIYSYSNSLIFFGFILLRSALSKKFSTSAVLIFDN